MLKPLNQYEQLSEACPRTENENGKQHTTNQTMQFATNIDVLRLYSGMLRNAQHDKIVVANYIDLADVV